MRRRRSRRGAHTPADLGRLPYGMLRPPADPASARALAALYHRGQQRAWSGPDVLAELVEAHDGVHVDPAAVAPIQRLFAVILWGELAAWRVSAELALHIEPVDAKLAATAQAHDEARHFTTMAAYLDLLGHQPGPLPGPAGRLLAEVMGAGHLAKKLVGMHLMIEPLALTLFQLVRSHDVEPVLCGLLQRFERDEARHVALGVHYLPQLIEDMGPLALAELAAWQLRMVMLQLDVLEDMGPDLRALGADPRQAFALGQRKQLAAVRQMQDKMGTRLPVADLMVHMAKIRLDLAFPERGQPGIGPRRAARAVLRQWRARGDVLQGVDTDVLAA